MRPSVRRLEVDAQHYALGATAAPIYTIRAAVYVRVSGAHLPRLLTSYGTTLERKLVLERCLCLRKSLFNADRLCSPPSAFPLARYYRILFAAPLNSDKREAGCKTPGMGVCAEMAKNQSHQRDRLHIQLVNRMLFTNFRVAAVVSLTIIRSQHAV